MQRRAWTPRSQRRLETGRKRNRRSVFVVALTGTALRRRKMSVIGRKSVIRPTAFTPRTADYGGSRSSCHGDALSPSAPHGSAGAQEVQAALAMGADQGGAVVLRPAARARRPT